MKRKLMEETFGKSKSTAKSQCNELIDASIGQTEPPKFTSMPASIGDFWQQSISSQQQSSAASDMYMGWKRSLEETQQQYGVGLSDGPLQSSTEAQRPFPQFSSNLDSKPLSGCVRNTLSEHNLSPSSRLRQFGTDSPPIRRRGSIPPPIQSNNKAIDDLYYDPITKELNWSLISK